MEKVVNINVGGISFTIDDNAYVKLKDYLNRFEATIADKSEAKEIMEDIELRIAEIFRETVKHDFQVVDEKLVDKVIARMGLPENENAKSPETPSKPYNLKPRKRLYRNPDDTMLSGVCGGLAAYFDIDPAIVRIALLAGIIFGGLSVWVYIILWIVVPRATTVAEKLEMRGEAVTAENIRDYTAKYK